MVYALVPHSGRGGSTWYTGSAGWLYQLIVERLLGVRLDVDKLRFFPCLPDAWPSFKLHYRYRDTFYHITIKNAGDRAATRVVVDGVDQPDDAVPLVNDRRDHSAEIQIA